MQVKAVPHQILQRYRWSVSAGYQVPLDRLPQPIPIDGLPSTSKNHLTLPAPFATSSTAQVGRRDGRRHNRARKLRK
jgi:hypothetical protein